MAGISELCRRFKDAVDKEAKCRAERIANGDMDADRYKRECGMRKGWQDCHAKFLEILKTMEKDDGV